MLREELQLLQEQGSYVGEVVKAMDKKKILVKVKSFTKLNIHYFCLRVGFTVRRCRFVSGFNLIKLVCFRNG